ncbi:uncharacterized protein [Diadema antillarum]|uniref:uncharacterized protein n=1 Tax=Diadema antillarum TaxID=105358 RepID=UPI003A8B4FFF
MAGSSTEVSVVGNTVKFDVAISHNFGYVYTKARAEMVKESHELEKTLRFVSLKTSAHFGRTAVDKCKHRILWEEAQRSHGGKIEYDGIPFMHLNKNIYECEYGKDHKFKTKVRAKAARAEKRKRETGNSNSARNLIQDTKKKDCQAKLVMKEVMKFPEFKITKNSNYDRRQAAQRAWSAIEAGKTNGERRIYIYLPEECEHEGHPVGKICGARQRVDHRIIEYIQRMVGAGVTSVGEMRLHIERFVSGALFWGKPGPDLSNRRYFPEDSDIRYHMYSAEAKKKFSKTNQSNLEVKISEWQKDDPAQLFFYRKGGKKTHRSEGNLGNQKQFNSEQQLQPVPHTQQQEQSLQQQVLHQYQATHQLMHHQQHMLPQDGSQQHAQQLEAKHLAQSQQLPQSNHHQEHQQMLQQLPLEHLQQMQVFHQHLINASSQQLPAPPLQPLQPPPAPPPPASQQQTQQQLGQHSETLQLPSQQSLPQQPLPLPDPTQAVVQVQSQPPRPLEPQQQQQQQHLQVQQPVPMVTPTGNNMLLVHQTAWQQYLLARYEPVQKMWSFIVYPRCSLPIYLVLVKTNCDYQVVATFVVEEAQQGQIVEAMSILKEWNPSWLPANFVTDAAIEDVNAVQQSFPGYSVYFCDYHRQYAWDQWLGSESNGHRSLRQSVLPLLERVAGSGTEGEYYAAVIHLQASPAWSENAGLREWLGRLWLPTHQRWVRAFRKQSFIKAVNTSAGVGLQNKLFRTTCLSSDKQLKLTQLISHILHRFLPKNKSAYFQSNSKADDGCRKYSSTVPTFLHKRPRPFLQACLQQWKATRSVRAEHVKLLDASCGIFHVQPTSRSATPDPLTVNLMRPDCSCKTWDRTALPCKHILAVLVHVDSWSWSDLPTSYTESPYFSIDYDFVHKIVGKQPIVARTGSEDTNGDLQHAEAHLDIAARETEQTTPLKPSLLIGRDRNDNGAAEPLQDSLPKKCHAVLERLHGKVALVEDEKILTSVLAILEKTETAVDRYIPREMVQGENGAGRPRSKRRKLANQNST